MGFGAALVFEQSVVIVLVIIVELAFLDGGLTAWRISLLPSFK